ncbi:TIGR03084 family metal-binding protein [uncultured Jatrophihabitans sp.]|uniref:TIGR03084 family metal-binding protein n=1 Tax=uncultured Jatrophihabitans sp. TaxID=1610747 RepID=UPI0035CAF493
MPAASPSVADVLEDLAAESADLDALVSPLDDARWSTATPAAGWTIAHQVAHLAWTDDMSLTAAGDADAFHELLARAAAEGPTAVDDAARDRAAQPPNALLAGWRQGRSALQDALAAVPAGTRLPWFGPPMSATSMATARLMETWAHGQDVADALDTTRPSTDRLRHVAHIGVRTRDFAYLQRGLPAPQQAFRVELVGPSGNLWAWGPEDALQHVAGPALDFCLLVTQRRHRADLRVVAAGTDADEWLDIAQAFAGPPGNGRTPGQFA